MIKHNLYEGFIRIIPFLPELQDENTLKNLNQFIQEHTRIQEYHKKETLITEGGVLDRLIFVDQGFMEGYTYSQKKGNKKIQYLWGEESFISNKNYTERDPLEINFQVMAGTRLISLSYKDLSQLFSEFPFTEQITRNIATSVEDYSGHRFLNQDLNAWEQLQQIRKAYKGIELGIPKSDIASFMGISAQYLSKIIRLYG